MIKIVDPKDLVLAINKKAAAILKSSVSEINPEKIISECMAKHMK